MSLATQLRLVYLRRKEKKLAAAADYHHTLSRDYGLKAYQTDQFQQPLAWGTAQHHANWHGYWKREALNKLSAVRVKLKELAA